MIDSWKCPDWHCCSMRQRARGHYGKQWRIEWQVFGDG
ncbi:hypothetical protein IMCC9480_3432 [Oxalobacteraceae bacterium IMCC9480]|nr:hypothetical protein IMCC9480_3432 [Oxalobacteraceae bacterium IMCC9480]